ncbi:ribosome biogenesis protein Nop16 [Xylariomycetidae sp. FL2044]|nr:ribosome biogenesis protein Nop16 [Xylariomycetidae sp. FL2044]
MGRDLQKRKRRSSRPAVRQPSSTKSKHLMNPLGNSTVAKNWNKNETTTQNYRRLGLVSRLKAPTGGVEPNLRSSKLEGRATKPVDPFAIEKGTNTVVTEARVELDENGKIVRVLDGFDGGSNKKKRKMMRPNPLNDPLAALDTDSEEDEEEDEAEAEEWGGIEEDGEGGESSSSSKGIVKQLEHEASRPEVKRPRTQSKREVEWIEALVERHGEDTRAMARDRRLNPMQQTEADISRRIRKWKGDSTS